MSTARGLHQRAPKWTPDEKVRWRHFAPTELDCKGNGNYYHDPQFLDRLESLRVAMGRPLVINSAHRSEGHNARVGGVPNSMHRTIAVDISLTGHDRVKLVREAIRAGFTGIGFGATFLHLDCRPRPTAWRYSGTLTAWARAFGYCPLARFTQSGLNGLLR